MPPKGRKSLNNCWYTCETCGVVLTYKDVEQHKTSSCPPDFNQWEHAFIKDKTLFSFLECCNINDNAKVREQEKHLFVYLSQSAMQLCDLEIGEQILIFPNNRQPTVRTVWPTAEKALMSVILQSSEPGEKLYEENCQVKIQKLISKPVPACSVHVTTSADLVLKSADQLLLSCKKIYNGKFLSRGSEISVPFFGKNIELIVKYISTSNDKIDEVLVHKLKNLNIKDSSHKDCCYYVIVETTKWEISQNMAVDNEFKNDEDNISIKNIGGYKDLVQDILTSISVALRKNNTVTCGSSFGILLYGPSGVGKTFFTHAIAKEINVHIVQINSGELFSKFYGETELRLRSLFTEAKDKSPSIIILDNVDTLCPKRGGTDQERRVMAYLLTLLDSLKNSKVVVLATTSQIHLVDISLRRPGRLDCEIELPIPSNSDRFEILKVLLSNEAIADVDVREVASAAHGYVAADLHCLVAKATMQAVANHRTDIQASDLLWALSLAKPSAMREVSLQVPNVKWTDIGGMDDLKLKLKQAIEWPVRHPESFSRLGIEPPRGVLMYGPPGCSKTMIAKALATESKLNFLSIKGSELFSKWVGESEKAVQSLFKKARAVAPSIVFLDELDALGGERSGSSEGNNVQERVLAQLLTEMDGVEPLGNVNIVAATNRPDRIDKALLRPGRLDRMVYVPLPDLETRICILQLQLVKMPVASDVVIDDLAKQTEGYSGAEVIAVCHEAAISALQEDFNVRDVHQRHFASALDMVKPRTPSSLLKLYDTYLN